MGWNQAFFLFNFESFCRNIHKTCMFHYEYSFPFLISRNCKQEIYLNDSPVYVYIQIEDHVHGKHHILLVLLLLFPKIHYSSTVSYTNQVFLTIRNPEHEFCASSNKQEFYNLFLSIFLHFQMLHLAFFLPIFCHKILLQRQSLPNPKLHLFF